MIERIQLKRTKGWRMPPNTVKVDRSTPFGNPFLKPANPTHDWRTTVVQQFEIWLTTTVEGKALQRRAQRQLVGKKLACWCPPGPCHADVLIRIANGNTV